QLGRGRRGVAGERQVEERDDEDAGEGRGGEQGFSDRAQLAGRVAAVGATQGEGGGAEQRGEGALRSDEGREQAEGDELAGGGGWPPRSEEHTSELQSLTNLVCRLLLEKKKKNATPHSCSETDPAI